MLFRSLPYLGSAFGEGGSKLKGETAMDELRRSWEIVTEELKRLPFLSTKPVAIRVQTTGRDLSQYATP